MGHPDNSGKRQCLTDAVELIGAGLGRLLIINDIEPRSFILNSN